MPTKTFTNLSAERQEEILMAAYEEFALNDFDSASLSSIIKKLGLAKGSFYRYFSSKTALYAFLVENGISRRLVRLDELIDKDADDFFALLEDNFISKVKFDLENPVIGGFLYRIMLEKNNGEVADVIESMMDIILGMVKSILRDPRFKKQIGKFDIELLAFNVFNIQVGLYSYISRRYKINFEDNILKNQPVLSLPEKELKKVIRQQIKILRDGIKS